MASKTQQSLDDVSVKIVETRYFNCFTEQLFDILEPEIAVHQQFEQL